MKLLWGVTTAKARTWTLTSSTPLLCWLLCQLAWFLFFSMEEECLSKISIQGGPTSVHCDPNDKNFKKEVRTLKLLPSSLRATCTSAYLNQEICLCLYMCVEIVDLPSSCLPVSYAVLSRASKYLWRCSKELLTLFWELGRVLSQTYFPFFPNTNSPLGQLYVMTHLMTWPFSPPHLIQHIQKLFLAFGQKSNSPGELLRLFSPQEITHTFILKTSPNFKHSTRRSELNEYAYKEKILMRNIDNVPCVNESHKRDEFYMQNQYLHQFFTKHTIAWTGTL